MNRARNFEGLMQIMHEAVASMNEARYLLERFKDTESLIAKKHISDAHRDLSAAARDLASGLVDLQELPFDRAQHQLIFGKTEFSLRDDSFPAQEEEEVVLTEVDMEEVNSVREVNFDFDTVPGDFGNAAMLEEDVPTVVLDD